MVSQSVSRDYLVVFNWWLGRFVGSEGASFPPSTVAWLAGRLGQPDLSPSRWSHGCSIMEVELLTERHGVQE